jgi:large subunit ribosomal protein L23
MTFARAILGPVVTEKAERLKTQPKRTFTLWVAKEATKIDVRNALEHFYDIDVESVRILCTTGKWRSFGGDSTMQKRTAMKKALVTLTKKSKSLDLTLFKNQ